LKNELDRRERMAEIVARADPLRLTEACQRAARLADRRSSFRILTSNKMQRQMAHEQ